MHVGAVLRPVGEPDEADVEALAREHVVEEMLVEAIGLAHLTLGAVTVYGMLELALRNADEDLDAGARAAPLHLSPNGTNGEDGRRTAAVEEERVNVALQGEVFGFGKTIVHREVEMCGTGKKRRNERI